MVSISYPNLREPEKDAIAKMLAVIANLNISDAILGDLVRAVRLRADAHTLALKALDFSEGRENLKSVLDLADSLRETETSVASNLQRNFVTNKLLEIESSTIKSKGLPWRLKCLNKSLGPLRKGDFGFITARPETGKTTFLASEVTHMMEYTNDPVIWFNNEEQGEKVRLRTVQATLGITQDEIWQNRDANQEAYDRLTKDKLFIYDEAAIHRRDVEALVHEYKPALVIFDQLDKIKGFDADRQDLVYGKIYQWARELSKGTLASIGVCQADGSGEGQKWLSMANVADAKCLDPNTLVLMYDGTWKPIKSITIGEQVMGPDSCPRTVLNTTRGREEMYRVTHNIGGESYIVNRSHILALKDQRGRLINRNVLEYKPSYFGYRTGYHLAEREVPIRPYFLGIWLGDGGQDKAEITTIDPEIIDEVKLECILNGFDYVQHLEKGHIVHARMRHKQGIRHPFLDTLKKWNLYRNKHIPDIYFQGSIDQRLELIAGLLDTDGTLAKRNHEYYSFSNKNESIARGLHKLALSCGLMSSLTKRDLYWYVSISGNDLSIIPTRILRKQSKYKTHKDVLKSRLTITPNGVGDYAGFVLDGDQLFIIEGCIVTHNTSKQAEADWILGIGRSHEVNTENVRFFNISKNKLLGDENTDPNERHGRFEVYIRPQIARYEDLA